MTGMGPSDGGDVPGMARSCQPVADRRPDRASLDRPVLALRRLAGDEQDNPRAHCYRPVEASIEKVVGGSEIVAVKIDDEIGLDHPPRQPAAPASVERRARNGLGPRSGGGR